MQLAAPGRNVQALASHRPGRRSVMNLKPGSTPQGASPDALRKREANGFEGVLEGHCAGLAWVRFIETGSNKYYCGTSGLARRAVAAWQSASNSANGKVARADSPNKPRLSSK